SHGQPTSGTAWDASITVWGIETTSATGTILIKVISPTSPAILSSVRASRQLYPFGARITRSVIQTSLQIGFSTKPGLHTFEGGWIFGKTTRKVQRSPSTTSSRLADQTLFHKAALSSLISFRMSPRLWRIVTH